MNHTLVRMLLVEPGEAPKEMMIEPSIESILDLVGGRVFQAIYPFDDPVCIICDDEGKLDGQEPNRMLRKDMDSTPYDMICGPFLVCGLGPDDEGEMGFTDLTDQMATKYMDMYKWPEHFICVAGRVFGISENPEGPICCLN